MLNCSFRVNLGCSRNSSGRSLKTKAADNARYWPVIICHRVPHYPVVLTRSIGPAIMHFHRAKINSVSTVLYVSKQETWYAYTQHIGTSYARRSIFVLNAIKVKYSYFQILRARSRRQKLFFKYNDKRLTRQVHRNNETRGQQTRRTLNLPPCWQGFMLCFHVFKYNPSYHIKPIHKMQ